ncbi:MAG TPA: helix-turn-helix transcriptional regulator [Pirellulales bacterium]|nr:helix-turn-helix transcriptional regulator [Pirellulales bacterium]
MPRQTVERNGKRFVLVEAGELRRLERLARMAAADEAELPPLPPADNEGNRPAVEYARVSIARSIVQGRRQLGLSQEELARLAGVRQETISRLESAKHSPTVRTVEKIDRALKRFAAQAEKKQTRKAARQGRK